LPEDMERWEANRAENEWQRAKTKRMAQRRCPGCRKGVGGGTPSKLESSGDDEEDKDEEEGEIIFPRSPLPENLHSPGDSFGR
jgi:hypothetical protein